MTQTHLKSHGGVLDEVDETMEQQHYNLKVVHSFEELLIHLRGGHNLVHSACH